MALSPDRGFDPTKTFDEFSRYDHGIGGGAASRAAWRCHKARCDEWRRSDPTGYFMAEAAACRRRVTEGLRALRVYVRLFRRTGDALLHKRNGIDYEKAMIRLWQRRMADAKSALQRGIEGPPG